jgi:Domain of unknown function (DUF1990)
MPRQPNKWRRLTTATRWPLGVTLTSWRYFWRTVPLHRTEEEGDSATDLPPPLPDGVSHEEIQSVQDGTGPLFHRRYRTRISDTELSPAELVDIVSSGPDWAAPTEFASFQKVKGEDGAMRVGDEFVVRMAGPWDGPVRVIEKTQDRFRMATLDTHLEAGQIEFRALREDDLVVFEIESWARSRDRLVHLLYDRLRMAKETQLHMWVSTLEGVVALSKGRMTRGIDIHTRKVEL